MRNVFFGFTILTVATSAHAQMRPTQSLRNADIASLPRSEPATMVVRGVRDYRIDATFHPDRTAHARALEEMNAINLRRPRVFRFRPVMALTLDAADIDGPAAMAGIAPTLMGVKSRH